MRRVLTLALATAATLAVASPASASLVYDANATLQAQGFGAAPRALSVQGTGNVTVESGCVGVNGSGGIIVGPGQGAACLPNSSGVHDANGQTNVGGDEPPPLTDNQKYGIPTVGSLGITSANQIGILFNVTDPGGNGVNLLDVTLKFYSSTGALIGAIDGSQTFSATDVGNGAAGFIFTVSPDELSYVNGLLGQAGSSTFRMALEATISGVHGGPETFAIVNLGNPPGAVPEPATWAMMLLGFGGIGMVMRRRRQSGRLLQIA